MVKKDIRVVFMGTSEFAVSILQKVQEKYTVIMAVCAPDKPVGRKQVLTAPPVKVAALELGLVVEQPPTLRENQSFIDRLKAMNPDIILVAAYGKFLPTAILNLPKFGCLNVHPSLLPKYRGPSPIQTALLNGDEETGVSIILMDEGMDTGDVVEQVEVVIQDEDYLELEKKLADRATNLLDNLIIDYVDGKLNLQTQNDNEATICKKIETGMGQIDWTRSAKAIYNQVRAIATEVGVFTFWKDKKLYFERVHLSDSSDGRQAGEVYFNSETKQIGIQCGSGSLIVEQLKMEGRNSLYIRDFINGQKDFVGSRLTS